ncbi:flavodoxin family protein [Mycoplasmatota bacterium]|nr:flavodoxin family protein [Mycoplasmatota bacterium]
MKVQVVSFSGRNKGNCSSLMNLIRDHYSNENVSTINVRDLIIHECSGCEYECMENVCPFIKDDLFSLFEITKEFDYLIWLVPMYCGNPSSLYFKVNERSQCYWMKDEKYYNHFASKLFIIGIGNGEVVSTFKNVLSLPFECQDINKHVMILSPHDYKLNSIVDLLVDVISVKNQILKFIPTIPSKK